MIRPDAIPVAAAASSVALDAALVVALFGRGYTLRGTERVQLARRGRDAGTATVTAGPPSLTLDALAADALAGLDGVRLVGPTGSAAAPPAHLLTPRLGLPAGLRRAWGVADAATLALGRVAVRAAVEDAATAGLTVDRALWLSAGRPATARWLAGDALLAPPASSPAVDSPIAITEIPRRVVTETDVRQARLHGRRLRLRPGQVVTPAAQSLAREWDVFAGEG